MPKHLVAVQTEYELGLSLDSVMLGNFGRGIGVNLDDADARVGKGKVGDLLVCLLALRVPIGPEVHHRLGSLVGLQVRVHFL